MFSSNGTTWKTILILAIYTFIVLVCWEKFPKFTWTEPINPKFSTESSTVSTTSKSPKKLNVTIYAATTYYHDLINSDFVLRRCPEMKNFCKVTNKFSDADTADAFVFHSRNFYETVSFKFQILFKRNFPSLTLPLLKNIRKPNVPWIIWNIESPSHEKLPGEKNLFNWTMTYRRDSDFSARYGALEKFIKTANISLEGIWKYKNKTATWLGSNCQTPNNRFRLVQRMIQEGLEADIWGSCGKPTGLCDGVLKQTEPCVLDLIRPYKFYLAVENSNCKDYVTEKFWKSLEDRMAVPIVLRRETVQDLGVPDSAYIAVDDFETLDEFIQHVIKVGSDKEMYLKYHEWRKDYRVVFDNGFYGWCQLCKRLQDPEEVGRNRRSYEDVERWHSFEMCDDNYTIKFIT
ncbi:hypothetical protein L3Y34_019115 [Caenorhabditis briggsae]|uniref:Fucosyltransferase n=1 Tax=Caenorhabditis briggsae TaxID=6238 RepID=A0AAE9IWB2_CAEBR|nr:hypothetical protein L3Y34_019115 [Caenorhabditis briggsae]